MPSVSAASAETPLGALERDSQGQRILLVAPAAPLALRTVTESSPPLMMATLRPAALQIARQPRVGARHLARLPR